MKKFLLIFAAVILTAISADVFAQGTGVAPAVGSTHNYSVAPTTANGDTYTWSLTTDAAGLVAAGAGIASLSSTGGVDESDIDITWVAPVIGTTYYLHVVETATVANGGCSNHKALAIKPANLFELEIVNVDLADATLANDFEICPAEVKVASYDGTNTGALADAQDFTYNYQKDSVYYKVTASGIDLTNTTWSPQFTIGDVNAATTVTAGWSSAISGPFTSLTNTDGTTSNDISVPTSANGIIYIKVVVNNSTTNEGLTANDVTVTLLDAANTSEDGNGNDVTNIGNGDRTQIVKARPATSTIGTTE